MNPLGRALMGVLVALISLILVLGSMSLALQENGVPLALERSQASATAIRAPRTDAPAGKPPSVEIPPTGSITALETPTPLDEDCQAPRGWVPYTVKVGDSVASLATGLGVDANTIMENNCLSIDVLIPGSELYLPGQPVVNSPTPIPPSATPTRCLPPAGWVRYQVRENDTLYRLSQTYGVSVSALQVANCMNSTYLRAGSTIYVPFEAPKPTRAPKHTKTPKPTRTPTQSPVTPTPTRTSIPPTRTVPVPTATPTVEIIRPTMTMTQTPVPPTATSTETALPPTTTPTATETPIPPTPTPTNTDTPTVLAGS